MIENEVSFKIRGAIFNVYNALGPGLLESIYEKALAYELKKIGSKIETQVEVPVCYDGQILDNSLRVDLLVDDLVIVEIKSVEKLIPLHHKQLLTYLRLTQKRLGILVNFNSENIAENIHRIVNNLK
ncbi:MAG: GxxExxY protein [Verrucomicrobia bacterium]|nr:GxxExxY protein [Verrucomicrobiota bacterium]